eukprot:s1599_g6.t1
MASSKGVLTPLSSEEQQLLQSLMLRSSLTQPRESADSVEGSVISDSGWSVMHEAAMTDASKRRLAESPPREARGSGYVSRAMPAPLPGSSSGVIPLEIQAFGATRKGVPVTLPPGIVDLNMWGRSVLEFGKYSSRNWTYQDVVSHQDPEVRSYVKWCRGQDVPAAFCYLSSHHPQLRSSMERFVNSGNTCPAWEHLIVSPLIAALPFWFRLLQCARRFYDTGQKRHLLNLGKYASSLMVVVVSSPGWPIWAVVLVSAIATVYAAWWDVCMDWGLTYTELCFLTRSAGGGSRYASPMHSPGGPGLPTSPAQSFHSVTFRSQPGGHASRQSVGQYNRHFSARIYCLAVLGDILLRCTWVITLMPITLLGKGVVWREILHVFMTVAEIFRRSFWAILRIEYEQVANASGYRALLWVPMKVGQKVGGDASAHGFRQSLLPG